MTNPARQPLTASKAWHALHEHARESAATDLVSLFQSDPQRASHLSLTVGKIFADFSRQKIRGQTLELLYALAEQQNVSTAIGELFTGGKINRSENRPALHTALRSDTNTLIVDDQNIMENIHSGRAGMAGIVAAIHSGKMQGFTGKRFTRVINIGIGGSDLGPRLAVRALHHYCRDVPVVRFVSNIDYRDLHASLDGADAETTLFIVASKTFTTLETLNNAESAREWLIANGCTDVASHFIAVTGNHAAATEFGIASDRILEFREWVGGRYSLWSTIGLPLAIAAGMDTFEELLTGARHMDEHFRTAPAEENLPVTLALIDVWNNNFLNTGTLAIVPYDHALSILPDYLSQLMMESNGKNVDQDGQQVDYKTGLIIWGGTGTNAQHAFFQLLHQGTHTVAVEFLVAMQSATDHAEHQLKLFANSIAQGEALMTGKQADINEPHRSFSGNRVSNTIMYERMTPYVLGQLLALYEHRTFVQACIWNINPFDQWGVELGKQLAGNIIDELRSGAIRTDHDAATRQLIEKWLAANK
ncbi:MAG: glucose-6-phosphate isomerase [Thiotrichales bacterium]|nr:glucose-6-phosphate isomerase [Thiotrichales bacterium]